MLHAALSDTTAVKSSLIIVKFFESRDALRMKSAVAKAEEVVKRRRRALRTDWKRSLWRKKARHMELEGSINFFLVFFHMFSPCFYYYLTCPWRVPDAPTFFLIFFLGRSLWSVYSAFFSSYFTSFSGVLHSL